MVWFIFILSLIHSCIHSFSLSVIHPFSLFPLSLSFILSLWFIHPSLIIYLFLFIHLLINSSLLSIHSLPLWFLHSLFDLFIYLFIYSFPLIPSFSPSDSFIIVSPPVWCFILSNNTGTIGPIAVLAYCSTILISVHRSTATSTSFGQIPPAAPYSSFDFTTPHPNPGSRAPLYFGYVCV